LLFRETTVKRALRIAPSESGASLSRNQWSKIPGAGHPHDDPVVVAEAGLPQDRVLRRDIQSQRSSDRAAIFIAVFFGSTPAVASSFASALAAAYFLYPPKFNFYIADPTHAAELGFILLLSVTASKATGVMTDGRRR
jgi:hypothetical protein